MALVPWNGIDLHDETHGRGPDILLTHGFGATCRRGDEQIEDFTGQHRLIVWDLPGHGQSGMPPGSFAINELIEGMTAILDHASCERVVLVGLGIGAMLSLRFWRAWPRRVRGLVLIGAIPGLRSGAVRELANLRVEMMAAQLDRHGLDGLEGGAEVDPRLHGSSADLARAARALLTQLDDGALPFLPDIDIPVLILAGGDDKASLSAAEYMTRTIPLARKVIVPRANHAVTVHKPEAANLAIRTFLARLPA